MKIQFKKNEFGEYIFKTYTVIKKEEGKSWGQWRLVNGEEWVEDFFTLKEIKQYLLEKEENTGE